MSTTTGKNRSILAGLVSPVTETPSGAGEGASAPPPARVTERLSALARVTSGDIKEKTLRLVDPARCRMWERHNRRYDLLNPQRCADLLESLRAQGVQEFPAIVRRIEGDPAFDYEVICGARRHWSVSYLRQVEHREIKFLIEERELTDEAAFRLADIENRSRLDISDYERALDYREAVESFYGGVARRMAERLEVKETWLSRFLDLAKLPRDVVDAFGDVLQLRENHARELKPHLAADPGRSRLMAAARKLASEQSSRREAGEAVLDAPKVVAVLKSAAAGQGPAKPAAKPSLVKNAHSAPLFTLKPKGPGRVVLELSLDSPATNEDFMAAFERELKRLRPATS
ncbi:chromosome partitioning protein ParB [Phenylobacterium sp. Root77]|jgi:ParB family chromosome partitioning protein|uniref:ParB/RepB/Spo0J family partition protein n=1 Tax=unclassified Phenylobacterium TaxID=2640670 RepID=UPI0006F8C0B3|nr:MULTISPECIES: ParB/RepB/Spo0J family partition protein [unclassified Phenylobacterium]KQW67053.1 chromosome partitioning protein ParB [Phenylobacterium sp. Root1277]KQW89746.1 chromosome partitioning protein ParB [Phenylobacterium sp. Root1290]KRC43565.1 chromosome partitioning protein ParB [Phenylobacterium sp. Root77]